MDMPNKLYDDASRLGSTMALIYLVIGIVIGILLLCSASIVYMKSNNNLVDTTGSVLKAECSQYKTKDTVVYECLIDVKYTVDNKEYTRQMSTIKSSPIAAGETVKITYDKTNPIDASVKTLSNGTIALILLVVGLLIAGGATFNYVLAKYFKLYAAGTGASTIWNLFR